MKDSLDKYSAKDGVDDTSFLRQFAAQIAVALREREDAENDGKGPEQRRRNQPGINESVEDLYHSLSFDEPMIDHIANLPVVAATLSRRLLASTPLQSASSYALSNRLVNGVFYMCQQQKTKAMSSPQEQERQPSTHVSSHSPESIAMAKLAFTILIGIPLECCRVTGGNNGMDSIRTLLGSYKGTSRMRDDEETADSDKEEMHDRDSERSHASNVIGDVSPQHDQKQSNEVVDGTHRISRCDDDQKIATNDAGETATAFQEEDEVWAAESDPSDYDFGDGTLSEVQQHLEQQWPEEDWLDPRVLSRPDPELTIDQASDAIATLLQLASYTLMEPIFSFSNRDVVSFTSQLTQLALLLLQPGSSSLVATAIRSRSTDNALLAPLWILRDAASYHTNDTSTRQSFVSFYLEALQTLLAVDQAHLQDVGGPNTLGGTAVELSVASIVGLSSLSSWCSMDRTYTPQTIDVVVDSMNDLTHVVERSIAGGAYNVNLSNVLIPIVEVLSGVYYDQVDTVRPTKSSIPQTLLNSGFLRQILVLAMEPEKPHASRIPMHHALWGLCVTYPTIVGKYAFGYPGVTDLLRQYVIKHDAPSSAQDCVQAVLWNMYGWLQCGGASSSSTASKIVWKTKSSLNSAAGPQTTSTVLSRDECNEVCLKAWSRLCHLVQEALQQSISISGSDGGGSSSSSINEDTIERVIREWGRLLVFFRVPAISANFVSLIDSSLLQDISKVLISLPRQEEKDDSTHANGAHDDDDRGIEDKKKGKTSRRHQIIAQAHRLLKEYKLCFQGTMTRSSKMD